MKKFSKFFVVGNWSQGVTMRSQVIFNTFRTSFGPFSDPYQIYIAFFVQNSPSKVNFYSFLSPIGSKIKHFPEVKFIQSWSRVYIECTQVIYGVIGSIFKPQVCFKTHLFWSRIQKLWKMSKFDFELGFGQNQNPGENEFCPTKIS